MLAEESAQPSQFKGRIIFMSLYVCHRNAIRVASFARDFEPGRRSFLGPGNEEKWYGSLIETPFGELELYSGDYDERVR